MGQDNQITVLNLTVEIKTCTRRIEALPSGDGWRRWRWRLQWAAVRVFNIMAGAAAHVPPRGSRYSPPLLTHRRRFIFYYFHNSYFTITTEKAFRTVSLWNHFHDPRGRSSAPAYRVPARTTYWAVFIYIITLRFVIHFIKCFTEIARRGVEMTLIII